MTADANAAFRRSLAINPTALGYANLGVSYLREGHYSDAVPLMEKAVEMDPNSSLFWGNLGDCYRWVPELKTRVPAAYLRAIKLVEQKLETNRSDAPLRSLLAEFYAKLPDRIRALTEIGQARRLAPNDLRVLVKSALIYEITGQRVLSGMQPAITELAAACADKHPADIAAFNRGPIPPLFP